MTPRPDLDSMAPSDGVVALRSLPRRYREAFEGDERRARADVAGADGVSALELLVDTARSLPLLERALEQIITTEQPVLHPGVLDPAQREYPGTGLETIAGALDDLKRVSEEFADRVDRIDAREWEREGTVAGGGSVSALGVLREAVRTGTDNLRRADQLLAP